MVVPASKVRALCTESEANLVRASRRPVLGQLTAAEVKRNAARARKLFDKWQKLDRDQSRSHRRKTGSGVRSTQTAIKVEIFQDAMQRFEGRLQDLAKSSVSPASGRSKTKAKQAATDHRSSRVVTRKLMRDAEETMQPPKKRAKTKRAAAKKTKKAKAASGATQKKKPQKQLKTKKKATKKGTKKASSPTKAKGPAAAKDSSGSTTKSKQRKATSAAKKARIDRSGKTSRTRGHVSARGRRAQTRRDRNQ